MVEYQHRGPADLVALLRAQLATRGTTAAWGGGVGLVGSLIHYQDLRRLWPGGAVSQRSLSAPPRPRTVWAADRNGRQRR
ncbi:hypothetical protein [Nocardioides caldifontis]|uniref:hypothetical protein n=1 Tax=Nocardioides caldifontis TaxID=2588938 RepID=UPI0011DF03F4|nr:hypothetical protein [Nocardioides caldifontis]